MVITVAAFNLSSPVAHILYRHPVCFKQSCLVIYFTANGLLPQLFLKWNTCIYLRLKFGALQSIAIQIEKISPNRPLTHDLFKSFAEHVHVVILEVVISDLKEGVFYSRIVCSDGATTFDIDARPSDAIAIGLRFGVPIFTVESVLSEAGIILSDLDEAENEGEEDDDEDDGDADGDAPKATRTQSAQALEKEDYEKAAKIRDELNKRNG